MQASGKISWTIPANGDRPPRLPLGYPLAYCFPLRMLIEGRPTLPPVADRPTDVCVSFIHGAVAQGNRVVELAGTCSCQRHRRRLDGLDSSPGFQLVVNRVDRKSVV